MALNRRMIQVPAYINEDWSVVFNYFCANFEFTITETVSETERKGYFNNLTDIPLTLKGKTNSGYHYIEVYLTYNKDDALDTNLTIDILDVTFYNNMNSKNFAYISGAGFLFIAPCDSTGIEYIDNNHRGFCITELLEKGTDNFLGKIIMVQQSSNAETYIKFNNLENIIHLASAYSNGGIYFPAMCGSPASYATASVMLPFFNFSTTNLSVLNTGTKKLYQLSFADKWYLKNLYTIVTSANGNKINIPLNYYSTLKADTEIYVANSVVHRALDNSNSTSTTTTYLLTKIT